MAAGADQSQVLLTRYLSDGTTDESFGSNGEVRNNFTKYADGANDMVLQPNGQILIVGDAASFFIDTGFLARYNTDGSPDNSFGINGLAKLPDTSGIARILLQKDGTIITGGYGFTVSKFKSDGSPDSSFGTNGYTITEGIGQAYGLCIQSDNKIVLSGFINDSVTSHITLARYNNDDLTKKQIIIKKIKHYIQTHNDARATTLNNVSIYPNPAQNILHVEGLSANAKLDVVDFTGNIKLQTVANASSYNLNIASLYAGNYLLKIEVNSEVVTKQFVKQ